MDHHELENQRFWKLLEIFENHQMEKFFSILPCPIGKKIFDIVLLVGHFLRK